MRRAAIYLSALILLHRLGACAVAPQPLNSEEQVIVDNTNALRRDAGLPELKINPLLMDTARKHAATMARVEKLEHRLFGKNSSARVEASGYKWTAVRENIALNLHDAAEAVDAWLKSDGHRVNIFANDVTEIGVGIATDSKGQPYYVQVFASPELKRVTVRFSVTNDAEPALSVDVNVGKLFTLKHNETATYNLTFSGESTVTFRCGGETLRVVPVDGARYAIRNYADGLSVVNESSNR
jgi:hypothetical protein